MQDTVRSTSGVLQKLAEYYVKILHLFSQAITGSRHGHWLNLLA